ncbi:MAG: MBL fold metallo-hydrolase [Actinomycetota bacterium]
MPEHFKLVETAPGVHAAVADITGAAVGNATIIDTGSKTVVVDTFMTAQAAAELRKAAVDLTGRSAFLVVNTHWHGDHTSGNQVFADAVIVSTRTTLDLMVANAPADLTAYEAEVDGYIASFRAKLESPNDSERALAKRRIAGLEQLRQAIPGFRLTLPDVLVDDRLVITGGRDLQVITYGGGHTDSDTFVWMPAERLLVSGDLCWTRIHPRIHDGHPAAWAAILDRVLDLNPVTVIPGHGSPAGSEVPAALAPYFRLVDAMVDKVRAGADPASLPLPAGSEGWDGPERLRDGLATLAKG